MAAGHPPHIASFTDFGPFLIAGVAYGFFPNK